LNHWLEQQLSDSVARIHNIFFATVIRQNYSDFPVIVGINHTDALRYSHLMLQR